MKSTDRDWHHEQLQTAGDDKFLVTYESGEVMLMDKNQVEKILKRCEKRDCSISEIGITQIQQCWNKEKSSTKSPFLPLYRRGHGYALR